MIKAWSHLAGMPENLSGRKHEAVAYLLFTAIYYKHQHTGTLSVLCYSLPACMLGLDSQQHGQQWSFAERFVQF